MSVIVIPRPLREKLGDEAVDSLVELVNKAGEDRKEGMITLFEEKFERRLSEVKAEIIKWMFIFWVGQIGAMFAILFAFLK